MVDVCIWLFFFFQAEDGIRDLTVTGVQTCALPICELVLGLKAHGHDVTVATRPSEIWVEKMRAAAVPYVPLPMASEVDVRSVKALVRILRSRRIQVVHAQKGRARPLALIARLFVRIPGIVLKRGVTFPFIPL